MKKHSKNYQNIIKIQELSAPICINGFRITKVSCNISALKNFIRAKEYIIDIAKSLDKQENLPLFEKIGYDPYYMTASATTMLIPLGAESKFRDSCFRIYPKEELIEFFHLGYIKDERKFKIKEEIIESRKEPI